MMYYLESPSTDPYFNLALEQVVFDRLDRAHEYFMLWQNDNAIIVGKHQNTAREINAAYVKEHGVKVVRRLSGGGAVYHDLGNLNFTFVVNGGAGAAFDFSLFFRPVADALASLGVAAEINGRNDMTIDGKKFSGNSQYMKEGRIMHHGTIMYDSDLSVVEKALAVPPDKIASKGIQSVRSRVTNVKPHMSENLPVEAFRDALRDFMFREFRLAARPFSEEELAAARELRDRVYSRWEWNYGRSPAHSIQKERRVEGCGRLEVGMEVKGGRVEAISFSGDYFGNGDSAELAELLRGCPLNEGALAERLADVEVGRYFNNLTREQFLEILTL